MTTFAQRFCALSVKAARKANRLAIRLRNAGEYSDEQQAMLYRELAKANMQTARERKQVARELGEWA